MPTPETAGRRRVSVLLTQTMVQQAWVTVDVPAAMTDEELESRLGDVYAAVEVDFEDVGYLGPEEGTHILDGEADEDDETDYTVDPGAS